MLEGPDYNRNSIGCSMTKKLTLCFAAYANARTCDLNVSRIAGSSRTIDYFRVANDGQRLFTLGAERRSPRGADALAAHPDLGLHQLDELYELGNGVQTQRSVLLIRPMTINAMGLKDRFDVLREINGSRLTRHDNHGDTDRNM